MAPAKKTTGKKTAVKKHVARAGKAAKAEPQVSLYTPVKVDKFDEDDFVSISQLAFAPTWNPEKTGESILVVPRAVRSFDAPSTKSGRATVIECQFISGDGSFVTGRDKTSSEVSEGDLVSVFVSAAFQADDQKGTRIVFPSGSDFIFTDLGEHMAEKIVPMKLTFNGMGKTKNKRKFKQIDIQLPRSVVASFMASTAAAHA